MVDVFGSTGEEGSLGNLQVLRRMIAISGTYVDYVKEIHASHTWYSIYRIASEGSPTFVFTYENSFVFLGAHLK